MNPKPILVGYDGSDGARQALRWALDEAVRTGAEIHLGYAFEWLNMALWVGPGLGPAPVPNDEVRRAIEMVLQTAISEAAETHPGVTVRGEVLDGPATMRLPELSAYAALVVLGSRGLGGFVGLLVGSTSATVAAHAHCPVVVVREPEQANGKRPIVVGVDGSEQSLLALGFAFEQAAARAVPLRVIRAWTPPEPSRRHPAGPGPDEALRIEQAALTSLLDGWPVRYPGVAVTAEVLAGNPAELLVAASSQAQLAVVGSRGRGGFRGLLLGSVSQQLMHHAHGPVAVIRERSTAPGAAG